MFEILKPILNSVLSYGIRILLISVLAGILVIVFVVSREIVSDFIMACLIGIGVGIFVWLILSIVAEVYRDQKNKIRNRMKQEHYHNEILISFLQSLDPYAERELEEIIKNNNKIMPAHFGYTIALSGKKVPDECWEMVDLPPNEGESQMSTKKGRRLRKDIYDELKMIWPVWEQIKRENLFR